MKKGIIVICMLCIMSLIGCSVQNMGRKQKEELVDFQSWCFYPDEYLTELRETYKLEELTADCQTEYEKVVKITQWVSGLWSHNGMNMPEYSDPLYILDQVVNYGKQYRCVEYGTVIYGCLQAIGIDSRIIALKTEDVETREHSAGHVACEVYLKDMNKWAFLDGQWGAIPTLEDTPLNAYEFGEAIRNKDERLQINWVNNVYHETDSSYFRWVAPYLFYLDVSYLNENGTATSVMFVPEGGKEVTIFQRNYTIDVDYYIRDIDVFYTK